MALPVAAGPCMVRAHDGASLPFSSSWSPEKYDAANNGIMAQLSVLWIRNRVAYPSLYTTALRRMRGTVSAESIVSPTGCITVAARGWGTESACSVRGICPGVTAACHAMRKPTATSVIGIMQALQ